MSILPDPFSTLRNIPAKPSGSLRSAGLVTHQRAFGAAEQQRFILSRALCRVSGMEIETEMAQRGRQYQTLESATGCGESRRRLLCS
ncbi:unnamed protein product [Sphagnum troendelagicum]|uniref:Uncharacterized protein n=1 Tax=Sphagnum troendelagicum TaxID=128251 RepID=A0ABP0TPA9_9BRYO